MAASRQWARLRVIEIMAAYASGGYRRLDVHALARDREARIRHRSSADGPESCPDDCQIADGRGDDLRIPNDSAELGVVLLECHRRQADQRVESFRWLLGQEGFGPGQQPHRRQDFVAIRRSSSGRGQAPAGAQAERSRAIVLGPQRQSIGARLVEVIAHDLVEVGDPIPRRQLEPIREMLVELPARR